jgi:pheromone shutdown protein TraB
MAEAIQRELSSGAKHVVGVVGLAHVPGIAANLQSTWINEKTQ